MQKTSQELSLWKEMGSVHHARKHQVSLHTRPAPPQILEAEVCLSLEQTRPHTMSTHTAYASLCCNRGDKDGMNFKCFWLKSRKAMTTTKTHWTWRLKKKLNSSPRGKLKPDKFLYLDFHIHLNFKTAPIIRLFILAGRISTLWL